MSQKWFEQKDVSTPSDWKIELAAFLRALTNLVKDIAPGIPKK